MFTDVSINLAYLQGIQAFFKRGSILPRVAASTARQISSTVLKIPSESVFFSFARYINGKRKKGVHSQVVTIFLLTFCRKWIKNDFFTLFIHV